MLKISVGLLKNDLKGIFFFFFERIGQNHQRQKKDAQGVEEEKIEKKVIN